MALEKPTSIRERLPSNLLRKGSSSKIPLKEKIVQIYEAFFRAEDPSLGNANFWDELFLLKLNSSFIATEFTKLSGEQLLVLKDNINTLFYQSICVIRDSSNDIRIFNALETISALTRGLQSKRLPDHGFDFIDILVGFDHADILMQSLIESSHALLTSARGDAVPMSVKQATLQMVLDIVVVADNVNQNSLLEYFTVNSLFESIQMILGNSAMRTHLGHDAVLLLSVLLQYRKTESVNPYIVKLSILDDELALTGLAAVISSVVTEFNRAYQQRHRPPAGFLSSLTSMVGNVLMLGEEIEADVVRANNSILLGFYEAIHLNRNFITTLTHCHAPSTPATPPDSPDSPALQKYGGTQSAQAEGIDWSAAVEEPSAQPTNLLVTFLEYTSIVMTQDLKERIFYDNTKLCMIILTCITEDTYANSLMHDANMNFRVPIHRAPMRHRKRPAAGARPPSRPLASTVLDLITEFIMSHMMKNFPMELYLSCIGILQRLICYQKRARVRLVFQWRAVWSALAVLLKYVVATEANLGKRHNIFPLCTKAILVLNLFITYGDTFLPSPAVYDELYYELIRVHAVFDNLYSMALRYSNDSTSPPATAFASTGGSPTQKEHAVRLASSLLNIRAIVNHFIPKIELSHSALSAVTEAEILKVVRANYESLTLKLHESLDTYERYAEQPRHTSFFTQLTRSIIAEVRTHNQLDSDALYRSLLLRRSSSSAGKGDLMTISVGSESALASPT